MRASNKPKNHTNWQTASWVCALPVLRCWEIKNKKGPNFQANIAQETKWISKDQFTTWLSFLQMQQSKWWLKRKQLALLSSGYAYITMHKWEFVDRIWYWHQVMLKERAHASKSMTHLDSQHASKDYAEWGPKRGLRVSSEYQQRGSRPWSYQGGHYGHSASPKGIRRLNKEFSDWPWMYWQMSHLLTP